jgi:hypothetical protein
MKTLSIKKLSYISLLIGMVTVFALCTPKAIPTTAVFYDYEVQFIRTGVEGTELFKVFAYGNNENECIERAKLDAVKALLFKGVPGSGLQRPMVTEVGAEEKYRDYFNTFFREGGKYLNYVAISNDGSIDDKDRFRVGKRLKIGVIVSVQKANLRRELEAANIVKKLDSGF